MHPWAFLKWTWNRSADRAEMLHGSGVMHAQLLVKKVRFRLRTHYFISRKTSDQFFSAIFFSVSWRGVIARKGDVVWGKIFELWHYLETSRKSSRSLILADQSSSNLWFMGFLEVLRPNVRFIFHKDLFYSPSWPFPRSIYPICPRSISSIPSGMSCVAITQPQCHINTNGNWSRNAMVNVSFRYDSVFRHELCFLNSFRR